MPDLDQKMPFTLATAQQTNGSHLVDFLLDQGNG